MNIHRFMSAANLRTPLLSLIVTAVLSLIPISSHAAVFWDDEMEAGNTGYPGLVANGYTCGGVVGFQYDTVNKISGTASLKENFGGIQYEACGGFADRYFPQTDDLWGRFYIRLSPNFVVGTISTKIMRNDTNTVQNHWWGMPWSSNFVALGLQNYPTNGAGKSFYPNVGDGSLPRGQFVCIETRIKHNTVGQADGLVEAYKNGVRFLYYTGLEIRKVSQGTQNAHFASNRMYRQNGGGSINYDRVAFGNTRIGCLGSVPASDSTLPTIPNGVSVR
jgi:hypothetical protein